MKNEKNEENKLTLEKVIDLYGKNVNMIVVYEPLIIEDEVVDDDSPYVFDGRGWNPQIPYELFNKIVEDFEVVEGDEGVVLEITLKPKE